ncbi:MAG: Fpg/Nei family DNA glycosylase [Actinomycetales bacterium]|nr:Fpg/Nei family DNA glycosylase [Actinomycetales bacterium]
MPELPEVQSLATDLGARLTGRVIRRLDVTEISALKTYDPPLSALEGGTIGAVGRLGKFLDLAVAPAAGGADLHLVIHLARGGWVRWRTGAPTTPRAGRGRGPLAARLLLEADAEGKDAGSGVDLTEYGTQKRLAVSLVRSPSEVPGVARLGPDPLAPEFTRDVLAAILAAQGRRQLKGVLRDQSVIGGIGNAYSDEILHVARMSPYKPADMPPADVDALYDALQLTLREALARAEGLAASELKAEKKANLRVHGRRGEPCPVCGDTIQQVEFTDSTFQYCPTCQTGGKKLSDRVLDRLLK